MLDSMIQMQLHIQAAQREKIQEKLERMGEGRTTEAGTATGGMAQCRSPERSREETDPKNKEEGFWERMERIRKRNQKREEMLAKQERERKQALRKARQEAYEAQLLLRKKRQQALDNQFVMQKIGERKENEKRGSLLMLARSADGRLPVSAEIAGAVSRGKF